MFLLYSGNLSFFLGSPLLLLKLAVASSDSQKVNTEVTVTLNLAIPHVVWIMKFCSHCQTRILWDYLIRHYLMNSNPIQPHFSGTPRKFDFQILSDFLKHINLTGTEHEPNLQIPLYYEREAQHK